MYSPQAIYLEQASKLCISCYFLVVPRCTAGLSSSYMFLRHLLGATSNNKRIAELEGLFFFISCTVLHCNAIRSGYGKEDSAHQPEGSAAQPGLPLDYSSVKTGFTLQAESSLLKRAHAKRCATNTTRAERTGRYFPAQAFEESAHHQAKPKV